MKMPKKFPHTFKRAGRTAQIKKWKGGIFATYFIHGGKEYRNTFTKLERAMLHLDRELKGLDQDAANSIALAPLNGSVRTYRELEQLLRDKADGATLREAVQYFLTHNPKRKFKPMAVADCIIKHLADQKNINNSPSQIETLKKHLNRFSATFGKRHIHEIESREVAEWLHGCKDAKKGKKWSPKTKNNVLGSVVSLALFSRDRLNAIPDTGGKLEFQKVKRSKPDPTKDVEIYTPEEIRILLEGAYAYDIDLIPILVLGSFLGLRPSEAHGEGVNRDKLRWESFLWTDKTLPLKGQKVRGNPTRTIPISSNAEKWLEPFKKVKGVVWRQKEAHSKKLISLRQKTGVRSIADGFRHSFCSYRIRIVGNDLNKVAYEMGNSPREIIDSYRRDVTDLNAKEWFSVLPPDDYTKKVEASLKLRKLL